jgi:hypothetical protein
VPDPLPLSEPQPAIVAVIAAATSNAITLFFILIPPQTVLLEMKILF